MRGSRYLSHAICDFIITNTFDNTNMLSRLIARNLKQAISAKI